jgi:hypothetical protein
MAWFLIALSIGVTISFFAAVLLKRLRVCHPRAYSALGSPSFIPNSLTHSVNWAFARFLWLQNPASLGDAQITLLVWLIRIETLFFLAWCFWPLLFPWVNGRGHS